MPSLEDLLDSESVEAAGVEFDAPASRQPMRKCEHGVYIAAGDETARYCTACNPAPADHVLAASMKRTKPACRVFEYERETDVAEFMSQPAGYRFAEMARALTLGDVL